MNGVAAVAYVAFAVIPWWDNQGHFFAAVAAMVHNLISSSTISELYRSGEASLGLKWAKVGREGIVGGMATQLH